MKTLVLHDSDGDVRLALHLDDQAEVSVENLGGARPVIQITWHNPNGLRGKTRLHFNTDDEADSAMVEVGIFMQGL
jgi:hypothetical protein